MKRQILAILLCCMIADNPAMAAEDYHDGDTQQTHVWIQEGDARFCYWNTGGWDTEDMLTGFHTIGDYVYYFSEQETDEWRYGHMISCYGGLE